jgi:poly(3-hydroxybutyrate) depolymerase
LTRPATAISALLLALLPLLLAGCSSSGPPDSPPRTATPSRALTSHTAAEVVPPGTTTHSLADRHYFLYSPPATSAGVPLILALHGLNNGAATLAKQTNLTAYARAHGLALAYPVGIDQAWNAGICCGGAKADDLDYLLKVVSDVEHRTRIDPRRVYLLGFSNGGMMALRAVCARPDIFAAAAVMAGDLVAPCRPQPGVRERPLAISQLQAGADPIVLYNGGYSPFLKLTLPPVSTELTRLPHGSLLTLRTVPGLAHHWATVANSKVDATSVLVSFLLAHPLAQG